MADNVDARPRATLLLTRPRDAAERFAARITQRRLPLNIVIAPLMEIVSVGKPPPLPDGTSLIFTSAHAVPHAGPGAGRRAWCVGPRTAEVAAAAGFDALLAGACADELVTRLRAEPQPGALIHLRGQHQRGDVAQRLGEAGLNVTSHVVYEQRNLPPGEEFVTALTASPLLVPLFSPRSAELFAKAAAQTWKPAPADAIFTLSDAVKAALPLEWTAYTGVVSRPDGMSMLDAIARRISP